MLLFLLGPSALAQAPATTTPPAPAAKPLSASLEMVVFPAKGQTAQQQSQDEGECYAWSQGQPGVDPMTPSPAAAQAAAAPATPSGPVADGSRVAGAVRGAAAGAVIGEVADNDAGKGAAIGAVVGTMRGGAVSRRKQAETQSQAQAAAAQQEAQQKAAQQEQIDLFKKGFGACLESKGYTVK
jgi:hypothetical protein